MGNKQASIVRASILNALCVFPEISERKLLITFAILTPRICTIVDKIGWNITAVDSHSVFSIKCQPRLSLDLCIQSKIDVFDLG